MPLITPHFVYYGCPRTGSTSVRATLLEMDIHFDIISPFHATPQDGGCIVVGNLRGFPIHSADLLGLPTVATRRQPKPWLASWRALIDSGQELTWDAPKWLLNARTVKWAEFAMDQYTQSCDHVVRTECLQSDLQDVFDKLGIDVEVPFVHVNKRNF